MEAKGKNSRLCGNLSMPDKHINSVITCMKHPNPCRVCGSDAYDLCNICIFNFELMTFKGSNSGKTCFFNHNDYSFWT